LGWVGVYKRNGDVDNHTPECSRARIGRKTKRQKVRYERRKGKKEPGQGLRGVFYIRGHRFFLRQQGGGGRCRQKNLNPGGREKKDRRFHSIGPNDVLEIRQDQGGQEKVGVVEKKICQDLINDCHCSEYIHPKSSSLGRAIVAGARYLPRPDCSLPWEIAKENLGFSFSRNVWPGGREMGLSRM